MLVRGSSLARDTAGKFYGTTAGGGDNNLCKKRGGGVAVFSLDVGLAPFAKTVATSGKVGMAVNILGTDLTDATTVSFNWTAAAFTIVSPTLIYHHRPCWRDDRQSSGDHTQPHAFE